LRGYKNSVGGSYGFPPEWHVVNTSSTEMDSYRMSYWCAYYLDHDWGSNGILSGGRAMRNWSFIDITDATSFKLMWG